MTLYNTTRLHVEDFLVLLRVRQCYLFIYRTGDGGGTLREARTVGSTKKGRKGEESEEEGSEKTPEKKETEGHLRL